MNGVQPLLRLRGQEIIRTWRIWAFPSMMVLLAAASAVLARFTNEILATALAGQGAAITLPDPTAADSYMQWINNLTQIALLVVIVVATGTISSEVRSGAAVNILVKPASRTAYVLTHAVALMSLVTVSAIVGSGVAWLATRMFFEHANILPLMIATATWLVLAYLLISVSILVSATNDSPSGAAGIGIGAFFVLAIFSAFPILATYTPAGLMSVASGLAAGTQAADHTLWWPIGTGVILTAAMLATATVAFRRREI